MKLKTNKLLTLTLASSLVAITAGCGGSKAAAPKTGTTTTPPADTVAYSDWSGSDDVTIAADDTENAFLAGVAATTGASPTAVTLTGLTAGEDATTLNLAYEVTAAGIPTGGTKSLNAETFGGAATNGVAFATNGDDTPADLRYVAGVVAGADLGAPLTTTTAAGVWNGIFQAVGANAVERDFILSVNFTDSEISAIVPLTGTDASAAGIMSYFFEGEFDDDGVITGDIIFGDFSAAADAAAALTAAGDALTAGTAADATAPATNGVGTLSGLIGENGALGAFYSTANGAAGYAGGFVALTAENVGGDDPHAVYADWSGSDDVTLVEATTANGFVAGATAGLGITALTANTVAINLNTVVTDPIPGTAGADGNPTAPDGVAGTPGTAGVQLGGAVTNGVAFAHNGDAGLRRYFAGLHSTTDLGAPLDSTTAGGVWAGLFQAIGDDDHATRKAFTLSVDFDTTTISAHIAAGTTAADTVFAADAMSYYLSGEFDAAGVVTGNIIFGDYSAGTDAATSLDLAEAAFGTATATGATGTATNGRGVLSGLIGATGAVGAFHSDGTDGTGLTGYAGGFVASKAADTAPAATPGADGADYVINYARWVPASPALVASATTTATAPTASAFVHGTGAALALPSTVTGAVALNLSSGDLTGDAMDGVAFITTGSTAIFHAGLHSTTDLGAPLTLATAGGTWAGLFQAVGATGYETDAVGFNLTVAFGTSAFSAHVPAGGNADTFTTAGHTSYYLAGTFDAATGLMTGTIIYGDYSTTPTTQDASTTAAIAALGVTATTTSGHGTVTGLIGQGGAIGAFISNQGGAIGYAGGFVANNP